MHWYPLRALNRISPDETTNRSFMSRSYAKRLVDLKKFELSTSALRNSQNLSYPQVLKRLKQWGQAQSLKSFLK